MLAQKRQKGFSLIEMMIVVVLVGVMSALAVGKFDKFFRQQRLKSAGRDLRSDLRLARSYAVSRRAQYGIYFDQNARQYVLFKDVVNPSNYTYDVGDSVVKTISLSSIFSLNNCTFPNTAVVYLSTGSGSSSGTVDIYNAELAKYVRIDILASTGRVRLTQS
ncbi:MAG: GspH/FimT family pseudopilin [candidate division Zixibacteria bacterium]|nr:GspH/FimT family pseudopilin [candidate division Zixibacteria bacterium]